MMENTKKSYLILYFNSSTFVMKSRIWNFKDFFLHIYSKGKKFKDIGKEILKNKIRKLTKRLKKVE